MVRIVSDTSTLYSTQQAREAGFAVSPLAVTIAGETYRELDEITPERFVEIIAKGNMPASSQPAIGEVMDLYQEYAGEEIINIAMADGLSGTYQSAVAAAEGVQKATGLQCGIKWTNDLVVGSKKLGGILAELSVDATGFVQYAVIGIGINCNHKPEDLPEELRDIAISLQTVTGQAVEIPRLAAALIGTLWETDRVLLSDRAAMMDRYREDCITLGRPVRVMGAEVKNATALDVDADGGLVVRYADGTVATVSSGEVSVRGLYGYL